jgi:hypothetical protein
MQLDWPLHVENLLSEIAFPHADLRTHPRLRKGSE